MSHTRLSRRHNLATCVPQRIRGFQGPADLRGRDRKVRGRGARRDGAPGGVCLSDRMRKVLQDSGGEKTGFAFRRLQSGRIRKNISRAAGSLPPAGVPVAFVEGIDKGEYFGDGAVQLGGDLFVYIEAAQDPDERGVFLDGHAMFFREEYDLFRSAPFPGGNPRGGIPCPVIFERDGDGYAFLSS